MLFVGVSLMFAVGGAITQAVLTGNSFPWMYTPM